MLGAFKDNPDVADGFKEFVLEGIHFESILNLDQNPELDGFLTIYGEKPDGIDLSKDSQAMSRLKEAGEKAKIELSGTGQTQINLPFITMKDGQPEHLDINLTKAKFDELTADLVEATMGPTRRAMKDSGVGKGDVDKVILVGGSTRIPSCLLYTSDAADE